MAVVMIIKDEDQVRVLAESVLQGHGHQTLSAGNAEQALALLESKEAIDVLFADIVLQATFRAGLPWLIRPLVTPKPLGRR